MHGNSFELSIALDTPEATIRLTGVLRQLSGENDKSEDELTADFTNAARHAIKCFSGERHTDVVNWLFDHEELWIGIRRAVFFPRMGRVCLEARDIGNVAFLGFVIQWVLAEVKSTKVVHIETDTGKLFSVSAHGHREFQVSDMRGTFEVELAAEARRAELRSRDSG